MIDLSYKITDYIVQQYLDGDRIGFTEETHLLESGILDSLAIFEVINFLVQELGIKIPESELVLKNFYSVKAISQLVERLQNPGNNI